MNIIISGANGFIGGELLNALAMGQSNFRPIAIGRFNLKQTADFYIVDLEKKKSVENFIKDIQIKKIKIDVFVHCAALMADATNQYDIQLFNQNNLITEHVILIVKQLNIKNLINLSSIAVYPNIDGEYFENSIINTAKNGDCLYGLAKFNSEELFNYFLTIDAVSVINLRVSQVYGDRMRKDRTYKIMENEMKQSNQITVWSNGERVSNFVEIDYVLKTILHFINKPTTGLFNVGGENLSYKELAEKVKTSNNNVDAEIKLVNKGVISKVYINSDKLKKELSNPI